MSNKPEMIVITERVPDPKDYCQYNTPMSFCSQCGCWMNCKRDGIDAEYRRRPNGDDETKGLVEQVLGIIRNGE